MRTYVERCSGIEVIAAAKPPGRLAWERDSRPPAPVDAALRSSRSEVPDPRPLNPSSGDLKRGRLLRLYRPFRTRLYSKSGTSGTLPQKQLSRRSRGCGWNGKGQSTPATHFPVLRLARLLSRRDRYADLACGCRPSSPVKPPERSGRSARLCSEVWRRAHTEWQRPCPDENRRCDRRPTAAALRQATRVPRSLAKTFVDLKMIFAESLCSRMLYVHWQRESHKE
jgi:hypothetical protein